MELPIRFTVLILLLLGLAAASCSREVLEDGPGTIDSPFGATEELPASPASAEPSSKATDTPLPALTIIAPPTRNPGSDSVAHPEEACANAAHFVQDVTIPDGDVLAPGASFTKTWRLTNSGTCAWDDNYGLVLVDGDLTGAPKAFPISQTVSPGETVDLSIPIIAPQAPGDHHANWLLRDGSGNSFGVGPQHDWPIWVRVIVQGDETQTDGRATPVSDSPAAGICGEAEGELATMTLLPGIPDPRCLIVHANQRLRVVNRTEGKVEISLAGMTQTLDPGGSYTFESELGKLLQPGVHALGVDPCCGGELWLKE